MRCEDTPEQWPRDGCQPKGRAKGALVFWAFVQGEQVDEDDDRAGERPCAAGASDGAADYEGGGIGGGGADYGAKFEEEYYADECPFGGEEGLESGV
jgi:hypothetical protein